MPARRSDVVIVNKNNRTCQIVEIAFPANKRGKIKEREKKYKNIDLSREQKI